MGDTRRVREAASTWSPWERMSLGVGWGYSLGYRTERMGDARRQDEAQKEWEEPHEG